MSNNLAELRFHDLSLRAITKLAESGAAPLRIPATDVAANNVGAAPIARPHRIAFIRKQL